jgi:hypothetical protein
LGHSSSWVRLGLSLEVINLWELIFLSQDISQILVLEQTSIFPRSLRRKFCLCYIGWKVIFPTSRRGVHRYKRVVTGWMTRRIDGSIILNSLTIRSIFIVWLLSFIGIHYWSKFNATLFDYHRHFSWQFMIFNFNVRVELCLHTSPVLVNRSLDGHLALDDIVNTIL